MNARKYRTGRLASAALALISAPVVHAQDVVPVPAPVPTPAPAPARTPSIITLPGISPEGFSIAPSPTPAPTARPAATPSSQPVQSPAVTVPRATPTPRSSAAAAPVARATPSVVTPPVAVETLPGAAVDTIAVPTPTPAPAPAASAVETQAPATDPTAGSTWPWALLGGGAVALVGLFGWLMLRRKQRDDEEDRILAVGLVGEPEEANSLLPAPAPSPAPARATLPLTPSAPRPAPVAPQPVQSPPAGEPFDIDLVPVVIDVNDQEVLLRIELSIGNTEQIAAENVRVSLAFSSARPDQDRMIASFHAQPTESGEPFDLAAGAGGRIAMQLLLPRDHVHVITVGGRPMFVPLVMVDVRWRSGLSIKRLGADFMVGLAGQGEKVGPIWLDRMTARARLAATRYRSRQVTAA